MNKEEINQVLNQLKDGELSEFHVSKEEFLLFRQVLMERPDFKYFRGIAQRGGEVIYEYLKEARS
ncbi:hypothetical protein SAMN05192533_111110 [Mesobacillus persicus]|uniref:Abortive phage infection protein n=1 Tax=Mesobacillus persicus TaxID=930146 RepID=A0A1H8FM52_9BACI|nr:hypothetical protein [Mesobacillus persicus]SEN32660.1 hypothetical protein SAMN05192533_111110 [Mesobacillus persicus]